MNFIDITPDRTRTIIITIYSSFCINVMQKSDKNTKRSSICCMSNQTIRGEDEESQV